MREEEKMLAGEIYDDNYDKGLLEKLFQNYPIAYFYVIPRNHNPLGTTLPTKQRQNILLLLEKKIYA